MFDTKSGRVSFDVSGESASGHHADSLSFHLAINTQEVKMGLTQTQEQQHEQS